MHVWAGICTSRHAKKVFNYVKIKYDSTCNIEVFVVQVQNQNLHFRITEGISVYLKTT